VNRIAPLHLDFLVDRKDRLPPDELRIVSEDPALDALPGVGRDASELDLGLAHRFPPGSELW